MNLPLRLTYNVRWAALLLLLFAGYLIAAILGLKHYISLESVNVALGILALCITLRFQINKNVSIRYFLSALVFAVLYYFLPAKTILMASISMFIFFLFECAFGKVTYQSLLSLFLLSPIASYLSDVFSFPVRLWLTQLSAQLLSLAGTGIRAEGNMLVSASTEFSVDPACIGLHMLTVSLLGGMMITGILQKRLGVTVDASVLATILGSIILLNIFSNLVRIIALVYFGIGPSSVMHDIIGLVCISLYVLLPSCYLILFLTGKFGREIQIETPGVNKNMMGIKYQLMHLCGIAICITLALGGQDKSVNTGTTYRPPLMPGFNFTQLSDGISKFENSKALVYVKPIAGFYSSDHQPMLCWSGSGYEFKKVREVTIAGESLYTSVLQKDNDVLYSAWWYSNGKSSTISQLDFRWDLLKGAPQYALVNVTAASEKELAAAIMNMRRD